MSEVREYTPTTEEVRGLYIHGVLDASGEGIDGADFDRWLAAHDAEVAARAWDEGHRVGWEHCQDGNYGTDAWDDDTPNPYRAAVTR